MDRVDERLVGDARGANRRRRPPASSSSGRSVSCSRKPSVARSFSSIGAVRQSRLTASQTSSPSAIRRDRGVGVRSEGALLRCETQPAKSSRSRGRPVGLAAHRQLERVGERPPEDLRPVVERLQDAARLGAALLADPVEDVRFSGLWPESTAASLRGPRGPARGGGGRRRLRRQTVCSKISSSEKPASFSACTSASVTL